MALLLIEGFEQYTLTDETELSRGGWLSSSGISTSFFNFVTGRHSGGRALSLVANGITLHRGVPATDVIVFGFAYKLLNSGPGGWTVIALRNATIDHLVLVITAGGELQLNRGVTQIDITSGLGIVQGVWYYIEIKATIHNSAGAYDVQVDGASVYSDTGVDTQNGGVAQIDNIELHGASSPDPVFDDIYVLDDAGSDNTDFLGDCRVETIFPDADGNENDFTASPAVSNYLNVDDGGSPDDDTTYNWSATATDRELYAFAALAGSIDTIYGVDAKMLVRKEDAGTRQIRIIGRNVATEVESADFTLGLDWVYRNHIFENNINGGADWTEAAVNTAEFGIDLQA